MYTCVHAQSLQSCPTLWDPMDHSPPGSSVHGVFQARILEWVAIPTCRRSSPPRDRTHVSCISCTEGRFFTTELPGKLPNYNRISTKTSHVSWPWSVRESNVSLWFIPTSIWSSVIWTILLHLHLSPIPTTVILLPNYNVCSLCSCHQAILWCQWCVLQFISTLTLNLETASGPTVWGLSTARRQS